MYEALAILILFVMLALGAGIVICVGMFATRKRRARGQF